MHYRIFYHSRPGDSNPLGPMDGFVSSLSLAPSSADGTAFAPSDVGQRFLLAEANYVALLEEHGSDGLVTEGKIDVAFAEVMLVSRLISDRRPTTVADLVDRALVARFWMIQSSDGRWLDLSEGNQATRAQAECVLSILRLAGLSDGTTERVGRVSRTPAP